MPSSFVTSRLDLRPLTHDDIDLLHALNGDEEVMRHITGRPLSVRESELELREALGTRWLAFERRDASFVGWVGAVPQPGQLDHFEIGWRFRRAVWGCGYASEAGRALVERLFGNGARRVFAQTMAVNERSRAVMARIGLRYSRTLHLHFDDPLPGTEEGEVEYELTLDEFHASAPP